MTTLEIRAVWDDEANVWMVDSDGVPGLIAEAATLEVQPRGERGTRLLSRNSVPSTPELALPASPSKIPALAQASVGSFNYGKRYS